MIKLAEISGVWYSTGEVYSPLDVKLTYELFFLLTVTVIMQTPD